MSISFFPTFNTFFLNLPMSDPDSTHWESLPLLLRRRTTCALLSGTMLGWSYYLLFTAHVVEISPLFAHAAHFLLIQSTKTFFKHAS